MKMYALHLIVVLIKLPFQIVYHFLLSPRVTVRKLRYALALNRVIQMQDAMRPGPRTNFPVIPLAIRGLVDCRCDLGF